MRQQADVVVTVNGAASNSVAFARRAGSIYYIAPSGIDANPCTEQAPCATLQHVAAAVLRAGDTVLVRGGTYSESEVWIRGDRGQSGTPEARKLLKAYPGESVTYANAARPMILNADYITVSGLNFTNRKSLGNGSDEAGQRVNWIINNTFRGSIGYEATGSTGDDHVLAGNVCEVSGSSQGTQGHCYYISFGSNVQLLYNIGRGAPGYGIHVFDQRRRAGDFRRVISNILIEGNTLTGSTRRAGLIVTMGDEDRIGNTIDGVTILNNTFGGNDQLGAVVGGNVRNVRMTGNAFVQIGRASCRERVCT